MGAEVLADGAPAGGGSGGGVSGYCSLRVVLLLGTEAAGMVDVGICGCLTGGPAGRKAWAAEAPGGP